MPKTSVASPTREFELPELLAQHLRFMIVLARLKELDSKSISDSQSGDNPVEPEVVKSLVTNLKLAKLFDTNNFEGVSLTIDPMQFSIWFGIKADSQSKKNPESSRKIADRDSPFNTLYNCRNFYALDAPNNLVQRFSRILEASINGYFNPEFDRESKHDRYVKQWGEYALSLVEKNNGWEEFIEIENLKNVKDDWFQANWQNNDSLESLSNKHWFEECQPKLNGNKNREVVFADNPNSLVKKILFLERDRYIQILTSTVSTLWVLWFLKSEKNITLIKYLSKRNSKDIYLGRTLPKKELYIDINTCIGKMYGLPYPFGFADYAISQVKKFNGDIEYNLGDPWPSSSQVQVFTQLQNESWCPPLLCAVRGDQSNPNYYVHPSINAVAPFIQISEKCTKFLKIYIHTDHFSKLPELDEASIKKLRFVVEEGTYGDKTVAILQSCGLTSAPLRLTRLEMAEDLLDRQRADIVMSFTPIDTLLMDSDKYKLLTWKHIYSKLPMLAPYLPQNFDSCLLCTGSSYRNQPRSKELLTDLCSYLGHAYYLFYYLCPDNLSLENKFNKIYAAYDDDDTDIGRIKDEGRQISSICNVVQVEKMRNLNTLARSKIEPEFIKTSFQEIGEDISQVLYPMNEKNKERFNNVWKEWKWLELLEILNDISIFITYDFP
jgi:hypothetical protein